MGGVGWVGHRHRKWWTLLPYCTRLLDSSRCTLVYLECRFEICSCQMTWNVTFTLGVAFILSPSCQSEIAILNELYSIPSILGAFWPQNGLGSNLRACNFPREDVLPDPPSCFLKQLSLGKFFLSWVSVPSNSNKVCILDCWPSC